MCGFYNQNLVLFSRHLEAEFFKVSKKTCQIVVLFIVIFFEKIQNPKISDLIRKYPIFGPISSTWERVQGKKTRQIVECCFFLLLFRKFNPKKSEQLRLFPISSNSTANLLNSLKTQFSSIDPLQFHEFFVLFCSCYQNGFFFCNNFQIFFRQITARHF